MESKESRYDVVVVGGGAAGLSGALTLARACRSVLVVDAGQPRNAPAGHVHNFLSRDGIAPAELLARGRAEVSAYGGHLRAGEAVSAQRTGEDGTGFHVRLSDGSVVAARRLLVSSGLVDELPDVPGVAQRWGRDVLHCPYCHGWEVRDQALGILVTGPLSVHQALLFRQWSADVTLFVHRGREPNDDEWEQLAARGIAVVEGEVAGLVISDDRLTGVRLATGQVIARQAVVVAPRFSARAAVLSSLGLEVAEQQMHGSALATYVPADPTGSTAVPGVWVAGNVTDPNAQVVGAAAAGVRAGAAINADLVAEDTRLAVARWRSGHDLPAAGQESPLGDLAAAGQGVRQ